MKDIVKKSLIESIKVKETFIRANISTLALLAERVAQAFISDHKLFLCGNGESATDAQHIATKFVNKYILERPPLPAIALTSDTSIITGIGDSCSFDDIFSKQIKALGMEGDVLLVISATGDSKNVLTAIQDARNQGMYTAGLVSADGEKLADMVDMALVVKSNIIPRIQEAHILAGHILCHLVDYIVFQRPVINE